MANNNEIENGEVILSVPLESEMKKSYLEYAMSVIVGRALPDIRDGLKPVHRRILFAMLELGNLPSKPFKKSAKIVGQVLGNYHPHGDQSIYDSLVRMAQDFSLRYPLVEGHGNFGSIDGDSPAAMRYTESRLSKISLELLDEIDQETVEFMPNFDATIEEPVYLPSKIPNLLLNGSSGIAVGMATNIPPHNLGEIVAGLIRIIDYPETTIDELMTIIKGPDFPTAGKIIGTSGIRSYFETGRGSIHLQGKGHIEEEKNYATYIIDELPYQVNKAELIKKIADLAKDKKLEGITDIRDESDRNGIRVVIELKKNMNPYIFENQLYKMTQYQNNFGVNMLTIIDQKPVTLGMIGMLNHFIRHRMDIVTKRTNFELRKSRARKHILDGLKLAIQNIDDIIKIIRASKDTSEAKLSLIQAYSFTDEQVAAILEMSLGRLTSMEQKKIDDEMTKLSNYIETLEFIIANDTNLLEEIKKELLEIKRKYEDKRRTEVVYTEGDGVLNAEDLIHDDSMVVSFTKDGYVKRMKSEEYKTQGRGGKGIKNVIKKEDDEILDIFFTTNHQKMLFFTNLGKVYSKKIFQIPECDRKQKGTPLSYLLPLDPDEVICTAVSIPEFKENFFLITLTTKGIIKKIPIKQFENIRKTGVRALRLRVGDQLKKVRLLGNEESIVIISKLGYAVRFKPDFRSMSRSGIGVKAIRLGVNDEVIGLELEEEGTELLCMTEKGFGKLTPFAKYRKTKRGARGVKAMRIDANSGNIAACRTLLPGMKLIITTSFGKVIQIDTNEIPKRLSRISRGVKLIRVDENDKVMAVARDILEEDEILEMKEKKVLKQNQFIMMRERKRIKDHKIKEDLELKKEADLNNEILNNEQKNNKEGEGEA
jgi:DNA gyrase subunit A